MAVSDQVAETAKLAARTGAPVISTVELERRLGEPGLVVVDLRPLPAFNGWRLGDEARGGHIPGAVAFPAAWLDSIEASEVERLLEAKGILAASEIVLYVDPPADGAAAAARLAELGLAGTRIYTDGLHRLGRRRHAAGRTARALRQARPPRLARGAARRRPARSRPGRPVPALPRELRRSRGVRGEPPPRRALPRHQPAREPATTGTAAHPRSSTTALRALGITNDTTVILYGRDTEGDANEKWPGRRAGQIAAAAPR